MKPHANTLTRNTSSADLMFSFGFSLVMHAVLLLVDPLGHFNIGDQLNEQQNGILMLNLKNGADEAQRKSMIQSPKAAAKKVSQRKETESKSLPSLKSNAPTAIARPVSPVHELVPVSKAPKVESSPISPAPAPVLPSDAPPQKEAAPKAETVLPAPVEVKVQVPEPAPIIAEADPEITITQNLKPKPARVKPIEKPIDPVSTEPRKEDIAKKVTEEKTIKPSFPEVRELVKPEARPTVPVVAAAIEPEEKHAVPVKEAPAKVEDQRSVSRMQEVKEPIKPEIPPPPPVVLAAAEPEVKHAPPVREEPAHQEVPLNMPLPVKTTEVKAEEPVVKQSPKPIPAITDQIEVKKEEKTGIDTAKQESRAARNTPVAPLIAKAPEAPAKAAETKAAAVVPRKTVTLSLLKRFAADNEPIRIGTPVGKPMIKITTPAVKKVSSKVQEIGGRVKGNGITRVILSINNDSVTIPVLNEKFHWEGAFLDGKNTISATAWDRNRYSATDQIIVEVMPAKNGFALSLEEPGAGELASPVIRVKGRVGDNTVDTARLIVNSESVEAVVVNGSFEKTVLFQDGENSLQAEAVNAKGETARSSILKVMVTKRKSPDILIHLYWEDADKELRAEAARKTRDNLDDDQAAVSAVEVTSLMSAHEGYREKIFAVTDAKAGAYVLSVSGGKKTKCLLSVTIPSKRKTRLFGPVLIEEEGTFIGRLLMPEGIYWDEDEWFTGKIENGDSVTKYNSPEGTTWKEIK